MVNLNEDVIWSGPGLYNVIWTGWLTKANRENANVKYDIALYKVVLLTYIKSWF